MKYREGRLTHFEALNAYIAAAVPDEDALGGIARDMGQWPSDAERLGIGR